MHLYTLTNKAKNTCRYFAPSTTRARELALEDGFTQELDNLYITAVKEAPPEYHEGVASIRLDSSTFNVETMQIEGVEDKSTLGWYGGGIQQPKVGNKWWD